MAKPPPPMPTPGSLQARVVNVLTGLNTLVYRVSGGRLAGKMQGLPVLILHHVGRKSGKERATPLLYLPDGDDVVIVASSGGSQHQAGWAYNLEAADMAGVEIKGERRPVRVRKATPEEKAAYWPRLVEGYSHYDDYQARTERDIPVFVLSPA